MNEVKNFPEILMTNGHATPVHPGEVLKDELEEIELTQTALAHHIGVLPKTIHEICRGRRGISPDMAMKLSKFFEKLRTSEKTLAGKGIMHHN